MSKGEPWHEYVDAVYRKIGIARYHEQRLLKLPYPGEAESIDVGIQAHFEGVLSAAVSGRDQLRAAINRCRRDGVVNTETLDAAETSLRDWCSQPIFIDATKLRNKATHCFYDKSQKGRFINVESVGGPYTGSRDLLDYSRALVEHLADIERQADDVKAVLPD